MHEGSITQSIMDTVLTTITDENVTGEVKSVHVTVGVCQGMVPESMQMFFDMGKPDTPLEHAELIITVQGIVAGCPKCNTEHELDIPVMFCPDCGEPMNLVKGNEIIISSIEVDV